MRSIVLDLGLIAANGFGQSRTAPAFEVASIKQASFPADGFFRGFSSLGTCTTARMRISGNRVALQRVTLCGLIMIAYDIPGGEGYRVTGAPSWMMKPDPSVYYDIQAKAERDGTLSLDEVRGMLQTLLADRFRLKLHRETREMKVYALVVDKDGAKLSSEPICDKPARASFRSSAAGITVCKPTESMDQFARELATRMDRPVLNMTQLSGKFAFAVTWEQDRGDTPRCSPAQEGCFNEPTRYDFGLISALQKQLGLKLVPRAAPVEVLVIDQAEKPTPN